MTEEVTTKKPSFWMAMKYRLAIMSVFMTSLVSMASAATLNESISPIITSVTELFVPLLALIIASVPLIIALAVIGFILGIFAAILSKLHV